MDQGRFQTNGVWSTRQTLRCGQMANYDMRKKKGVGCLCKINPACSSYSRTDQLIFRHDFVRFSLTSRGRKVFWRIGDIGRNIFVRVRLRPVRQGPLNHKTHPYSGKGLLDGRWLRLPPDIPLPLRTHVPELEGGSHGCGRRQRGEHDWDPVGLPALDHLLDASLAQLLRPAVADQQYRCWYYAVSEGCARVCDEPLFVLWGLEYSVL